MTNHYLNDAARALRAAARILDTIAIDLQAKTIPQQSIDYHINRAKTQIDVALIRMNGVVPE